MKRKKNLQHLQSIDKTTSSISTLMKRDMNE